MAKIITFGCRINAFEAEVLKEKLAERDDIVVINTCAVTGEAERQCKQAIRKLRKENPRAKIVVTGCAAQINPKKFAEMQEVDLVLGNKEKAQIEKYLTGEIVEKSVVGDIFSYDKCDDYLISGFEDRHKAFVQVQQGCNYRCSYCIVPFARGKSRSVAKEHVLAQIKELLAGGFSQICLTGVDICSYEPSLVDLAQYILDNTPEECVLSFGSLDPAKLGDEFAALTSEKRIMPYFHLSVQSGDNEILKKMRRRHTREDVIAACEKIRQKREDAIFGADFICGFPTETEENFADTCKLVEEAGIKNLHVFPYSERKGTPAALMPQVEVNIRRKRAKILREKGENND